MKRRKRWQRIVSILCIIVMLAGIVTAVLTGCAKETTPEKLLEDMEKNVGQIESAAGNLKMNIAMMAEGQEVELALDFDIDIILPDTSYMKGTMNVGGSGMEMSVDMEACQVEEDDGLAAYILVDDMWTREVMDAGLSDSLTVIGADAADRFTVGEEQVEVNGRKCFELTGSIDGEDVL